MTRWLNDSGAAGWLRHHWDHTEQPLVRCRRNVNTSFEVTFNGNQSTRHTVNSSHRKIVWRVDRHVWRRCDELTILFNLAFVAFKIFAVIGDFDIAHIKPK